MRGSLIYERRFLFLPILDQIINRGIESRVTMPDIIRAVPEL
jgi:hypothetical protein